MDSTPWYNLGGISSHPCSVLHGFCYILCTRRDAISFRKFRGCHQYVFCLSLFNGGQFLHSIIPAASIHKMPEFLTQQQRLLTFLVVMCSTPFRSFSCKAANHWLLYLYSFPPFPVPNSPPPKWLEMFTLLSSFSMYTVS